MRHFSFYDPRTGAFHGCAVGINAPEDENVDVLLAKNAPAGHVAIEGEFDPGCHRVNVATGLVETRERVVDAAADAAQRRQATLAAIAVKEASQLRALRELALGRAGARERLEAIDAEIAALRPALA